MECLLSFGAESFVYRFGIKRSNKLYRTIMLPVDLYGCENRSPTVREKHSLWVFKNRTVKRIFRSKRDAGNRGVEKIKQ